MKVLPVRFRGLESLSPAGSRALFGEALAALRAQLSPERFEWLGAHLVYVRACEQADRVSLEFARTHEFLRRRGSGQSDGLVLVEDQKLPGFGVDLGIVEADHAALTIPSLLSNSSVSERKAFTRALLREVFSRPMAAQPAAHPP